jgi:hypothetical protein
MKKKIIILSFVLCLFFGFFSTALAALNLKDAFKVDDKNVGDVLDNAAATAGYNVSSSAGYPSPEKIVAQVIQIALSFLGVIFLILMIYGGFIWMTGRGNEEQVKKAQGLIQAAVIGMIIVVSAYAITYFILSNIGAGTLNQAVT